MEELSRVDPYRDLDEASRRQFAEAIEAMEDIESDYQAVEGAIEKLRQVENRLLRFEATQRQAD